MTLFLLFADIRISILNQEKMDNILHSSTAESLALIGILTKISNSPILLKAQADAAKAKGGEAIQRAGVQEALALLPHKAEIFDFSLSGSILHLPDIEPKTKTLFERKTLSLGTSFESYTTGG